MTEQVYTRDIIKAVVTSMKSSGSITSVSESDGTWTIITSDTGNLKDNFKVLIGSNYYRVTNVNTTFKTSFDVVTSDTITDEMTWGMYIDFIFESPINAVGEIYMKGKNQKRNEKFDLIWLFNVIPEGEPLENELIDKEADITMSIVTDVSSKLTSDERFTQIFKTRLYPLYDLFIKKLKESDSININANESLVINKTDWMNYGIKNNKNVFNEPTSAIEFTTTIKVKKQFSLNIC